MGMGLNQFRSFHDQFKRPYPAAFLIRGKCLTWQGKELAEPMKPIFHLLCIISLIFACQGSGIKQTKDIIVYGSDNCDHCVEFKAKLDSVGFEYDFRDVEFDQMMAHEMTYKVRRSGVSGGFSYPVIDVEGKILVAPELEEVLQLMQDQG